MDTSALGFLCIFFAIFAACAGALALSIGNYPLAAINVALVAINLTIAFINLRRGA